MRGDGSAAVAGRPTRPAGPHQRTTARNQPHHGPRRVHTTMPYSVDFSTVLVSTLRRAARSVPAGAYAVDAEQLRQARQGTPRGEYHVDAEALRQARQGTPAGEYHAA